MIKEMSQTEKVPSAFISVYFATFYHQLIQNNSDSAKWFMWFSTSVAPTTRFLVFLFQESISGKQEVEQFIFLQP